MTSIFTQFQLNDQQPIEANLPAQFTLDDFKRVADIVYNNTSYLYSFVCHGKEFDLNEEDKFNQYKSLITSGTTIFTIEHTKSGCFLSDTLIQRADLRQISISDIQIGDALLAFTNSDEIVTTSVEHIFIYEVDEYVEVQFGHNRLCVTGEHPIYIGNGQFCSLSTLHISDCIYHLIDGNLQPTVITGIKTIKATTTRVYNLRTAQPHTYFANEIAVHNKFGTTFADLTKSNNLKRMEWILNAPNWRMARPGICIEGECSNPSCVAYKQLVVINIGIKKFDLLVESGRMSKCPECLQYVQPITCAFNRCKWRWKGMMQTSDNAEPKQVSEDWKLADNAYHRFDENFDEAVVWRQLIFKAKAK